MKKLVIVAAVLLALSIVSFIIWLVNAALDCPA